MRGAGTGHSFNALVSTNETMIDIRSLDKVLGIDVGAREIQVEAGITLNALDEAVARKGLALATEPTISEVTAGGAIATASHGTGLAHGALSEEVTALQIIDADGRKHTIDDEDRLRAARVGLGCLGVIYAITFRLVPAFRLAIHERVVREQEAFDNLDQLLAENEHVDLFWFQTEQKVFLRTYHRTTEPRRVSVARDWLEEWLVRTLGARVGLALASKSHPIARALNYIEPYFFPKSRTTVDRSDRIFHRFPGHQKVYSMEYIIPLARTREALGAVTDSLGVTGFYPNVPVYLRFVGGAGDGDLSPMRGRQSCAIEVLSGVNFEGWEEYFRDLEPRFIALGGRPHWGKMFFANPRPLYEASAWTHVEALRAQIDPDGKFVNELSHRLFRPQG